MNKMQMNMMQEFLLGQLIAHGVGEANGCITHQTPLTDTALQRTLTWMILYHEAERRGFIQHNKITEKGLTYIKENEHGNSIDGGTTDQQGEGIADQ